jgi:hypothetical protein
MHAMPDSEKERLCYELLREFGVTKINRGTDGELIHSCVLPFHPGADRHPSASLNYKRLLINCFSCGGSGSLLWFIATCRGTSSTKARGWLDNQTGADGDTLSALLQFFDKLYSPKVTDTEPMPKYSTKVLEPWSYRHPYLEEVRHVSLRTQDQFRVCYDPKAQRIVIPLFWGDPSALVGWTSRRLIDDGTPKYTHSPSFPRRKTIYNYDPRREAIVVESPMSVLTRWNRCPVIEATFGCEVTEQQIRLLAKHPKVILFFDSDDAGVKATYDVAERLSGYTDVKCVTNPYTADPGDLDDNTFGDLIADAVPWSIWEHVVDLKEFVCP